MNQKDFVKLTGAEKGEADYLPVACLLRSGYACVGYFNRTLNEDFDDTCVLVNGRIIELQGADARGKQYTINDFNDFLEEIVGNYHKKQADPLSPKSDEYGKTIPLTAIPYDEIAIVYPVAHIGALLKRAQQEKKELPEFMDFDKSEILKLLRTKLW
jgi:hypothetical protein